LPAADIASDVLLGVHWGAGLTPYDRRELAPARVILRALAGKTLDTADIDELLASLGLIEDFGLFLHPVADEARELRRFLDVLRTFMTRDARLELDEWLRWAREFLKDATVSEPERQDPPEASVSA
jgi:hypothetical protein